MPFNRLATVETLASYLTRPRGHRLRLDVSDVCRSLSSAATREGAEFTYLPIGNHRLLSDWVGDNQGNRLKDTVDVMLVLIRWLRSDACRELVAAKSQARRFESSPKRENDIQSSSAEEYLSRVLASMTEAGSALESAMSKVRQTPEERALNDEFSAECIKFYESVCAELKYDHDAVFTFETLYLGFRVVLSVLEKSFTVMITGVADKELVDLETRLRLLSQLNYDRARLIDYRRTFEEKREYNAQKEALREKIVKDLCLPVTDDFKGRLNYSNHCVDFKVTSGALTADIYDLRTGKQLEQNDATAFLSKLNNDFQHWRFKARGRY